MKTKDKVRKRIKIEDLPENFKVSEDDLKQVVGGLMNEKASCERRDSGGGPGFYSICGACYGCSTTTTILLRDVSCSCSSSCSCGQGL
jgi:hypothetical protein